MSLRVKFEMPPLFFSLRVKLEMPPLFQRPRAYGFDYDLFAKDLSFSNQSRRRLNCFVLVEL